MIIPTTLLNRINPKHQQAYELMNFDLTKSEAKFISEFHLDVFKKFLKQVQDDEFVRRFTAEMGWSISMRIQCIWFTVNYRMTWSEDDSEIYRWQFESIQNVVRPRSDPQLYARDLAWMTISSISTLWLCLILFTDQNICMNFEMLKSNTFWAAFSDALTRVLDLSGGVKYLLA